MLAAQQQTSPTRADGVNSCIMFLSGPSFWKVGKVCRHTRITKLNHGVFTDAAAIPVTVPILFRARSRGVGSNARMLWLRSQKHCYPATRLYMEFKEALCIAGENFIFIAFDPRHTTAGNAIGH